MNANKKATLRALIQKCFEAAERCRYLYCDVRIEGPADRGEFERLDRMREEARLNDIAARAELDAFIDVL